MLGSGRICSQDAWFANNQGITSVTLLAGLVRRVWFNHRLQENITW
jgi:hypothetical protein